MSHFKDVGTFMSTFGQDVHKQFVDPGVDIVKLRMELICEEFKEVFSEVVSSSSINGMTGKSILSTMSKLIADLTPEDISINHVNLSKELFDLEYVVLGAGHAFGVDQDAMFDEGQRSNMSKLGPDGKPIYRDDGKVLKGPDYFKVDAADVMFKAGCYPIAADNLTETFHNLDSGI